MQHSVDLKGMRWFKCDLHMHTPADANHWRGAPIGNDLSYSAENYIRHCYEAKLECIAITDHNFKSMDFIPSLTAAIDKLSNEYGYKIALFPGFEITADVGRGMHLLAIFEQQTDLTHIDHALTNCGVPMPRQHSNGSHKPSEKNLASILPVVQELDKEGLLKGIVICPHPFETGIFDSERISEWLQQNEWKNSNLYAVEVPKSIYQMSKGWQCLFGNGEDCWSDWKRARPMAALKSSDAKALNEGENPENYIGKRYCWIKMSVPSIESLRQAFLDPESRICLEPECPMADHIHVEKIDIKGSKFLKDQEVKFSPHLNCLIGGRGSGKSMLFESIRLGLRGETS